MKSLLALIAAGSLLAGLAVADPPHLHYTVTDLGTLPGGTFSSGSQGNTENGLIGGAADVAGGAQHAVLWFKNHIFDIAKPGLGGQNSFTIGLNDLAQAVGQAETSVTDTEDFCAYGTGFQCLPFVWQLGVMTPLPTLGGKNGAVSAINRRGQAAGVAQTAVRDPNCPAPLVHTYQAVTWGPRFGEVHELHPLPGDTVGVALWMNDLGQVVGTSGSCANTVVTPPIVGPHAVLWDRDGTVHDLGNLGGTVNTAARAVGNRGLGINNRGEVVGGSTIFGNATAHAFLWTKERGMRDLGVLPGDFNSGALSINEKGAIVGVSNNRQGNPRAFLWQNGEINDLNTLAPDSPLYLLFALGINDLGEIAGFGVTEEGEVHAFLASPTLRDDRHREGAGRPRPTVLSDSVRELLRQRLGIRGE